jgi:type I restriction enzyme M protein
MGTATARTNGANGLPHSRKQRLFELHSFLRSVDNLRPDEALDEIAKLFEYWVGMRSFEGVAERGDLGISPEARNGAVSRLEPLLGELEPGQGADLFQELADVGVRAGMGQYFTPPPVADAMAAFLQPLPGETWLDPFCGSGLLLGAVATRASGPVQLFGIDRDPRVLHLARVEAALRHPASPLVLLHANALEEAPGLLDRVGAPVGGVDGVIANPPFGAEIHIADTEAYAAFDLARGGRKVALEILGLEQCIRMLRPGGRLGIVLPQGVLSNRSLAPVREYVLSGCRVDGVLSLPGETFTPYKGVNKASVLFLTRSEGRGARVRLGVSTSVGWDSTGKPSGTSDVAAVAEAMLADGGGPEQSVALARNLSAEWLLRPEVDGIRLGDLCTAVFTGRTPARAAYTPTGDSPDAHRLLKVGDLTGSGIDWSPGERSFAAFAKSPSRRLQVGDLATTAAAHHRRYIAAKVDIVDCLPTGFEERCAVVAEVLVMRPDPAKVDPFVLLLWLRTAEGREALQSCVTGQTAHLSADDVADVVVPHEILRRDAAHAVDAIRTSLRLRRESEAAAAEAVRRFAPPGGA